ncbi:MAG TPA: hypothetical protein PKD55_23040, partial [Bellilinea sp.]|nr:hypothetical protein [Bellilinea sp.]
MYHLIQKQTFIDHFVDLNRDLQRRICKDLEILSQAPNNAASKNIENLGRQRELWTFRVNDNYRLLYAIAGPFVQLIDVGKHDY